MDSKYKAYEGEDDYFRGSSIRPETDNIENLQMEKMTISNKDVEPKCDILLPTLNKFTKNDFEVIELLGKGAYAKVVKALYVKSKEVKAIKIIDKNFMERENKLYQVYLENKILQSIDHPNIIKTEGIFEENDKIFIVLEYLGGGDFFEFLKINAPLKYETSQYFAGQIVNALEYLHGKSIAHRDLKPENLMLDNNYHIKIVKYFV